MEIIGEIVGQRKYDGDIFSLVAFKDRRLDSGYDNFWIKGEFKIGSIVTITLKIQEMADVPFG